MRPPASWTTRDTSPTSLSKRPRVLGTVSIIPAVLEETSLRTTSALTRPLSSEATLTTLKPPIGALAGLVPWAESGTRISSLSGASVVT